MEGITAMNQREIKIEDPVNSCGFTIIPIVRILTGSMHVESAFSFYAGKEPAAMIIARGSFCRIYNVEGKEISMEIFMKQFPEQAALLKTIIHNDNEQSETH
jgi:uncharacterized spore protein YtfJ